jgi:hypothetical protein
MNKTRWCLITMMIPLKMLFVKKEIDYENLKSGCIIRAPMSANGIHLVNDRNYNMVKQITYYNNTNTYHQSISICWRQ